MFKTVGQGASRNWQINKKVRGVCVVAVVVGMVAAASPAFADTTGITGELNRSGSLVTYDSTRTHSFTGPITLNASETTSTYLRLGLRNDNQQDRPQFTDTTQWNSPSSKEFTAGGTNQILVGTRFSFQGRMGECGWPCGTQWSGSLSY